MKIIQYKKIYIFYLILTLGFLISHTSKATDIYDTMSIAYVNSPKLKALRAKLKASNEEISKVLSNKRPTINISGKYGRDKTKTTNIAGVESTRNNSPSSVELEIKQNLYDSGKIKYQLDKTDNIIFADRAELEAMEQEILLITAKSYLDLFTSKDLHKLAKNNLIVLKKHLDATKSRFDVGEVTKTDLSQAKARLLKAKANEIKTRGDIEIEKSKYFAIVGAEPPNKLEFPNSYPKLPKTLKESVELAIKNNPKVIEAGFRKKSSFLDISVAASDLLPRLDLNLSAQNAWDPNTFFDEYENYTIDFSLNVPLYQGGKSYANVREKRNLAVQQSKNYDANLKEIVKNVEVVWLSLQNIKYQLKAIESSIYANDIALQGVREEEKVGTRTTLDVLDAEQELLIDNVEYVKAKKELFYLSFKLMESLGFLTPENLKLDIKTENNNIYYNKIKKLWLGFEPS